MTVAQFHELAEVDQLMILIQNGILIGEIKEGDCRLFMYKVDDFYVETKFSLETDNLINIDCFSTIDREGKTRWAILKLTPLHKEKYRD